MARPRLTKKQRPQKLQTPGKICIELPSAADIRNDLLAGFYPLFKLGVAAISKGWPIEWYSKANTVRTETNHTGDATTKSTTSPMKDEIAAVQEFLGAKGTRDSAGRRLWQLLAATLMEAFAEVVNVQRELFAQSRADEFLMQFTIPESIGDNRQFDATFLSRPYILVENTEIEKVIHNLFSSILISDAADLDFCLLQFERCFTILFWKNLRSDKGYYQPLLDHLSSPDTGAYNWFLAEAEHKSIMTSAASEPVLGASFSLANIFVPPRAAVWGGART